MLNRYAGVTPVDSLYRLHPLEVLFLLSAVAVAMALARLATTSGPGVSPDSMAYIGMAENLVQGRGLTSDLAGPFAVEPRGPSTTYPPGYSLLIALLMQLRTDAVTASRLASALSFGVVLASVYLCGRLLSTHFVAVLSTLVVLTFTPLFRWSTFALSETTFAALTLLSLNSLLVWIAGQEDRAAAGMRWIVLSGLLASLAILTRYLGIVWLGRGALAIAVARRKDLRSAVLPIAVYSSGALMLVGPWLLRNFLRTGYLTGIDRAVGYHPDFVTNVRLMSVAFIEDMLPSLHFGLRELFAERPVQTLAVASTGVVVILALGVMYAWRSRRSFSLAPFVNALAGSMIWVLALYIVGYIGFVFVYSNTRQFAPYDWPRYLMPVYPMVLVLLFSLLEMLLKSTMSEGRAGWRYASLLLIALFLTVPNGNETLGFARAAANGQGLTQRLWRANEGLAYLTAIVDDDDIVYSDKPWAVTFHLQRPARFLPYAGNRSEVRRFFDERPHKSVEHEYIILFKGEAGQQDPYFRPRLAYDSLLGDAEWRRELVVLEESEDAVVLGFRRQGS